MVLKILFVLLISISAQAKKIKIVALGDSVTAGYGVAKEDAYPALLEKALQNLRNKEEDG